MAKLSNADGRPPEKQSEKQRQIRAKARLGGPLAGVIDGAACVWTTPYRPLVLTCDPRYPSCRFLIRRSRGHLGQARGDQIIQPDRREAGRAMPGLIGRPEAGDGLARSAQPADRRVFLSSLLHSAETCRESRKDMCPAPATRETWGAPGAILSRGSTS